MPIVHRTQRILVCIDERSEHDRIRIFVVHRQKKTEWMPTTHVPDRQAKIAPASNQVTWENQQRLQTDISSGPVAAVIADAHGLPLAERSYSKASQCPCASVGAHTDNTSYENPASGITYRNSKLTSPENESFVSVSSLVCRDLFGKMRGRWSGDTQAATFKDIIVQIGKERGRSHTKARLRHVTSAAYQTHHGSRFFS